MLIKKVFVRQYMIIYYVNILFIKNYMYHIKPLFHSFIWYRSYYVLFKEISTIWSTVKNSTEVRIISHNFLILEKRIKILFRVIKYGFNHRLFIFFCRVMVLRHQKSINSIKGNTDFLLCTIQNLSVITCICTCTNNVKGFSLLQSQVG